MIPMEDGNSHIGAHVWTRGVISDIRSIQSIRLDREQSQCAQGVLSDHLM